MSGSRPAAAEPLTARTRARLGALRVSPESTSNVSARLRQYEASEDPEFALAPLRPVESRLSYGQGGLVVSSAEDLSDNPLEEADADEMTSHGSRSRGEGGNALPIDLTSDSDMAEGHEPLGADGEDDEGGSAAEPERKEEVTAPHGWPPLREYPMWYLRRLKGFDQSLDVYGFYPAWDQLVAFVFVCLTMVVLGLINHYGFRHLGNGTISAFIPAFGASCTVVYAVPKAPIAQPRNVIIAHVTAAIIGTALTNAFRSVSEQPFGQHCAGAIGVGLHLALMMSTNTMHPPASATVISAAISPINAYYRDEGFLFCLTPVLFGALVVCVMAWLLNNLLVCRGPYPQYW